MNLYPPGARIAGRYEVAGRPLMGGMGVVYICLDTETDRPVALKTFRPELLPDRAARDRFLREGTAWVDLGAHPHVVRCYNVLYIDPEVYLVLELIAKEQGRDDASLRAWLTPGQPMPVEQALLFALQIARGMNHATDVILGFVHRDLKPENVLVGADHLSSTPINRLRVTDFGLAAVLESASERVSESAMRDTEHAIRNTQLTHGAVGTPLYMAPEQWRGQPITAATDVYALGCILYEMLAGERAVSGHSLTTLQRAHCAGEVHPLPEGLPAAVSEIVTRSLALEPGERHGGWGQVEAALVAAYEGLADRPAPQPEPVALVSRAERVAAGWSYNAIGTSYLDIGKAEVALGYFERTREAGETEEEPWLVGVALGSLGNAYMDLSDARRAIGYYEQFLSISREIQGQRWEGSALMGLGNAYRDLGEVRRAIECYEQALAIHREIGDRREEGNGLGNLGIAYHHLGEMHQAIKCFERQLIIGREIGDRRGECAALGNLGVAYRNLGKVQCAIGCYEQCLIIHCETGDRRGEGRSLGNLGNAYLQLGNARRATGYYEQSLAVAREIGDRQVEGSALGNLGNAYVALDEFRQAIGYYEQALVIRREIGDRMGMANDLFNVSRLYVLQGKLDQALPLVQQAAEIWEGIGGPYAQRARQAQQAIAQLLAALR